MFERQTESLDNSIVCNGIEFGFNGANSECWFAITAQSDSCNVSVYSNFEPLELGHSVREDEQGFKFPTLRIAGGSLVIEFDTHIEYTQFCNHFNLTPCKTVLSSVSNSITEGR